MEDMARAGSWLNLISIGLITLFIYFLMPLLWGIDLNAFPADLAK
jgi:solute carrier family 13 (sodium-dependent dicarboxylate transporter), member 2/3/5